MMVVGRVKNRQNGHILLRSRADRQIGKWHLMQLQLRRAFRAFLSAEMGH